MTKTTKQTAGYRFDVLQAEQQRLVRLRAVTSDPGALGEIAHQLAEIEGQIKASAGPAKDLFEVQLELVRLIREEKRLAANLKPGEHTSTQLKAARQQVASDEAEVESQRGRLVELDQQIKDGTTALEEARSRLEAIDQQLRPWTSLIAEREDQLARVSRDFASAAANANAPLTDIATTLVARMTLQEALSLNHARRDELMDARARQAADCEKLQDRVGRLKLESAQVQRELFRSEEQLKKAHHTASEWAAALQKLSDDLAVTSRRIAELQEAGVARPQ